MKPGRTIARGFAALAAVFLLVVLAALGAFMVSVSNAQQLGAAQDLQSTRAYWAARAGLEWAFGAVAANPGACPASAGVPGSVDTGAGFDLSVTCTLRTYTELGQSVQIYNFESTARSGSVGSPGFVERSVSASFEVAP